MMLDLIFDSISHLSFVDGQLIEQKPPNQPFTNEQLKQIDSTPDNSLQPTKQEDEEKKTLKGKRRRREAIRPLHSIQSNKQRFH